MLGQHRYRPAGDDGKAVADDSLVDSLEDEEERRRGETAVRVRYDARLYGPRRPGQKEPLSIPFLKKYIAFAKQRFAAPELTLEASEAISEYYAELRNTAEVKALPVTVRSLETIIRLSCAHAKVRLSAYVERQDVEEVQALIDMIMKSDPSAQETRKAARREDNRTKRTRGGDSSDDDDEEGDGGEGAQEGVAAMGVEAASGDDGDEQISDADEPASPAEGVVRSASPVGDVRDIITRVVMDLGQANSGAASVTGVASVLRAKRLSVGRAEIMEVLQELHDQENIMLEGEEFFLSS